MNKILEFKLNLVPHTPGCYLWKGKYGQVIYVGKAVDLYKRTHQYFNNKTSLKTKKLVENIADIDFVTVANENESLILENNLIKKYQPKYNILLKEGSNYPYIAITKEKDPRIIYTRNFFTKCYRYYGPFASSKSNKYEIFNLVNQLFPLRKCYKLPKKKCLYYDLGQCLGPCINKISDSKYKDIITQIDDFFKGNTTNIFHQLQTKEKKLAEDLNFEDAKLIKELIDNINEIQTSQSINLCTKESIDVIGYSLKDEYISISIFSYINGKLLTKNQQIDSINDNNFSDSLVSYLMQFYLGNNNKPKKCYISLENQILRKLSKTLKIEFINPLQGKFKSILINASINAKQYYQSNYFQYLKKQSLDFIAFEELKKMLKLDNLSLIHSFDMSNLFGEVKVGAMIAIENGEFNNKLYHKFIIDNDKLTGDTQYMEEVVYRQYTNVLKNKEPLPNLIIADGGINQINAIKNSLKKLNLDQIIPVIGLAKDKHHNTEKIVIDKTHTIKLDKKSNLFLYLKKIQDEVHRFAINFFHKKKSVSLFRSKLDEIPGIGKVTIDKLIKIYNNIANIKDASVNELTQYVGKKNAKLIHDALNK